MTEWLVVHTERFALFAEGPFESRELAIQSIFDSAVEFGYEPYEEETPMSYYLDLDDTWVVSYDRGSS